MIEEGRTGEAAEGGCDTGVKGVPQLARFKRRGQEKQQREGVPLKEVSKPWQDVCLQAEHVRCAN